MPWCFALVNNRLAEVYFNETRRGPRITGHCYVKMEDFSTAKEKKWIKKDTEKLRFIFRKRRYKRINITPTD